MILIITNKLDPHVDVVIEHLNKQRVQFVRFNTEDFPQRATFTWQVNSQRIDGTLELPLGRKISFSEISSCWYRRPTTPIVSKDIITQQAKEFAQDEASTLLKGLWTCLIDRFWINHPFKIQQAESKMANLKLAAEIGFFIPQTLISSNPDEVRDFFKKCEERVINKVLGKGQVEYMRDYYFIYTHKVLPEDLDRFDSIRYAPALFQEYIPKNVEIRVTVMGNKVFSCEIHSQDSKRTIDDWRHYDFNNVKHAVHKLPQIIEALCLKMMKKLELNFVTFDLVLTPDGQYVFLELNPNGQWLWIEQLTGLSIGNAIAETLIKENLK